MALAVLAVAAVLIGFVVHAEGSVARNGVNCRTLGLEVLHLPAMLPMQSLHKFTELTGETYDTLAKLKIVDAANQLDIAAKSSGTIIEPLELDENAYFAAHKSDQVHGLVDPLDTCSTAPRAKRCDRLEVVATVQRGLSLFVCAVDLLTVAQQLLQRITRKGHIDIVL